MDLNTNICSVRCAWYTGDKWHTLAWDLMDHTHYLNHCPQHCEKNKPLAAKETMWIIVKNNWWHTSVWRHVSAVSYYITVSPILCSKWVGTNIIISIFSKSSGKISHRKSHLRTWCAISLQCVRQYKQCDMLSTQQQLLNKLYTYISLVRLCYVHSYFSV